jgi:hypothetical protein
LAIGFGSFKALFGGPLVLNSNYSHIDFPRTTNKPQQYQFDTDLAVVLVLLD